MFNIFRSSQPSYSADGNRVIFEESATTDFGNLLWDLKRNKIYVVDPQSIEGVIAHRLPIAFTYRSLNRLRLYDLSDRDNFELIKVINIGSLSSFKFSQDDSYILLRETGPVEDTIYYVPLLWKLAKPLTLLQLLAIDAVRNHKELGEEPQIIAILASVDPEMRNIFLPDFFSEQTTKKAPISGTKRKK